MASKVYIYGEIGGDEYGAVTADSFRRELSYTDGPVEVRISSPGGSVSEGLAIYNEILSERASGRTIDTYCEGAAWSIASVILQAGRRRYVSSAGLVMVHLPSIGRGGDVNDLKKSIAALEKVADTLVGIYTKTTKQSETTVRSWMEGETWFLCKEAITAGLADFEVAEVAADWTASLAAVSNLGYKVPEYYLQKTRAPVESALAEFARKVDYAVKNVDESWGGIARRDAIRLAEKITKIPGRTSADLSIVCSGLDRIPKPTYLFEPRGQ